MKLFPLDRADCCFEYKNMTDKGQHKMCKYENMNYGIKNNPKFRVSGNHRPQTYGIYITTMYILRHHPFYTRIPGQEYVGIWYNETT